ncbi:MAG: hypothetical protein ACR2NM_01075, partial [Bythopirellula sp.]
AVANGSDVTYFDVAVRNTKNAADACKSGGQIPRSLRYFGMTGRALRYCGMTRTALRYFGMT